jgi:hypothetical protein
MPIRQIAVCDFGADGAHPVAAALGTAGVSGMFWAPHEFRGFTDMLNSDWLEKWLES